MPEQILLQGKILGTEEFLLAGSAEGRTVRSAGEDLLAGKSQIETALWQELRDLFSIEPELVFYDITSTYFEGRGPAEAMEDIEVQAGLEIEFDDGAAEEGESLVVVQVVAMFGAEDAVAEEILGMVYEISPDSVPIRLVAIGRGLDLVLAHRNPERGPGRFQG